MKVRHVEELHDSPVTTPVRHPPQSCSILVNHVWMAVVVFAGQEQKPLTIRRPLRHKIEGPTRIDAPRLRAIRAGDVNLIALVISDEFTVRRSAETVGELVGIL